MKLPSPTPGVPPIVRRLFRHGTHIARQLHQDTLYGEREFGWPIHALYVRRELGPVRHVLAQRVVAGTLIIHTPLERAQEGPVPPPNLTSEEG